YCCRVQNVPFVRPVCPAEEVRYLVSSKERGCGCRSDRPCAKWSCLRALEDSENRPPSVLRSWVMDRYCAHPSTQPCPGRSTYADGVHRSPAASGSGAVRSAQYLGPMKESIRATSFR